MKLQTIEDLKTFSKRQLTFVFAVLIAGLMVGFELGVMFVVWYWKK
jgi:hypothetical protein